MNDKQGLTTGTISRKLIAYALPLLAANLFQSFYNFMDMLVVGKIVGETGLVVVSSASILSLIINSACVGITMDGTVLAAQYKGAKDEHGQIEIIGTLFTTASTAAVLVTTAGLAAYRLPFRLLHVPMPAMEDVCGYMKIIYYGTIFIFGYNAVCPIMKGLGDPKSLLYFVAAATVINLVLDLLLVGPFGTGTEGAACAAVLSQGISFVVSMSHLKQKDSASDSRPSHFSIKTDGLAATPKVGLPIAV